MMNPSTKTFIDISIPVLVFFTMIVIGLDLTIEDFRRVTRKPKAVMVGTLFQLIFLPILALVIVYMLEPKPYIFSGMLLLAACPGGGISNYYVYLARSNVALSVTLTAVSCLLAAVTLPLIMNGYEFYLNNTFDFSVPFPLLFAQLFVTLVIPAALGMYLRHSKPVFTEQYEAVFRGVSIAALTGIVGFIIYQEYENLLAGIKDTVAASIVFIVTSMTVGLGTGSILGLNTHDRFTMLVEFAVRNVAIATAIAVSVLER